MARKLAENNIWRIIILLILLTPLFSGCGGQETDEVALVLAVGIDKGKDVPLELTITVANPRAVAAGGGGGGGQEKTFFNFSVDGPSIWQCYVLLNSISSRQINFQHTRCFIIGEELAKEGLGKYLNALVRQREVRRNSTLYICRGKARDFMEKNKPRLEMSPAKQYEFMDRMTAFTGLQPAANLHDFYVTLKSLHSSPTAPLVGLARGDDKARLKTVKPLLIPYVAGEVPQEKATEGQFIGSAVFREDKMAGYLTGGETRTMLLLQGKFKVSTFTMKDPHREGNVVTLRLRKGKPNEVRVTAKEGVLGIHETIFLEGEFWSIQSGENYEDPKKKKLVEDAFDREMERLARNLIEKTRAKDYGDIFKFDRYYRKELNSWEEWQNLKWKKIYDAAEITVDFKTNIRRPGLLRKTEPIAKE